MEKNGKPLTGEKLARDQEQEFPDQDLVFRAQGGTVDQFVIKMAAKKAQKGETHG